MLELKFEDFQIVQSFFENKKQCIPALSVIHGHFPGRVFVDQIEHPNVVVVWATSRWMYIEGTLLANDYAKFNQFVQDVIISDCKKRNESWFEIYSSDLEIWDEVFLEQLEGVKGEKHYESVYALNISKFNETKNAILPYVNHVGEVDIKVMDYDILPASFHQDANIKDEYKTRTSVGVEIRQDTEVIAVCRNNGFVYGNEYFIDVDTFRQEERGKGYATLAAVNLITSLLEKNMYPLWETTHQNLPSHKLALKLGFEVIDNYPVYAFSI